MTVDEILESLLKRQGLKGKYELLHDMIDDSILEVRSMLNYQEEEDLPDGIVPVIKDLTLIKFNQDGAEGIQTESHSSGGSVTYMDKLPDRSRRLIRRYRRLPR